MLLCTRDSGIGLFATCGVFAIAAWAASGARGAELWVGAATADITPPLPAPLDGQMHTRIAKTAETPLAAEAVALESREGDKPLDQAVLVACDLVAVREGVMGEVRKRVAQRVPGLAPEKIVLSATHTHTAPVQSEGKYQLPAEGVLQPAECVEFLAGRITDLVVRAWEGRKPGTVGFGLGHAVVAHNRRAVYADGRAQMYGRTDAPDFRHVEAGEDHGVEMLFFWDADQKPLAMAVNVACPAQEVEGLSVVHADFWHEVRQPLRARYGKDLVVLGWIGAAGDQSPHLMYRKAAEERMRSLRGLTRVQEIARRIVAAVEDVYDLAAKDARADVPLVHKVLALKLPVRMVTEEEAARAKAQVEELSKDPRNQRRALWHQDVVDRFERQTPETRCEIEVHVLRLGDVAVATNPFELFTDFGVQMKARSKAVQTFVVQLVGSAGYLPTERAVRGGGYSAIAESNRVGPEGGQVLADATVETINAFWPEGEKPGK